MRDLPSSLQSSLDSGATTLARCWAVTRNDGLTLGFTDHDRDLSFEGISFEPESGFTPSAVESGTGLAPDTHTVQGALQSPKLTEQDLRKGLYDGAEVAIEAPTFAISSSASHAATSKPGNGRMDHVRTARSGTTLNATP